MPLLRGGGVVVPGVGTTPRRTGPDGV